MGQRNSAVAAPLKAVVEQSFRDTEAAAICAQAELINLCCELRKLNLVIGRGDYLRQFGDRREQSIQRSLDKTIQSLKETFEIVQAQANIDGNPVSTGNFGPMGASWYLRLGAKIRELLDEIPGPAHGAGPNEPAHAGSVQLETETGGSGSDPAKNFRFMLQLARK